VIWGRSLSVAVRTPLRNHPSLSPFAGDSSLFVGAYLGGMTHGGSPPLITPPISIVVAFLLTDTGDRFHVAAGDGVARVFAGGYDAGATVRLPQRVWIALLLGLTSLAEALLADGVEAEGDLAEFVRFYRRFTTTTAVPPQQPRREEPLLAVPRGGPDAGGSALHRARRSCTSRRS
jgi:hypothetical protein